GLGGHSDTRCSMSGALPHAPLGEPPGPGDQRCKEAGLQMITRLASSLRIGRTYQSENQVFRGQVTGLFTTLSPLLETDGEAVLVALQEDLYLNGVRIPVKAGELPVPPPAPHAVQPPH